MKHLIIGVDPGNSGAVAVYSVKLKTLIALFDMPLIAKANGAKIIDALFLRNQLMKFQTALVGAVIEDIGSMPKNSATSMLAFGYSAGVVSGVVATLDCQIQLIKPAVWKLNLGLSPDKQKSLDLAIASFPTYSELFKRKKDDGRAEAALLAKYGERIQWQ